MFYRVDQHGDPDDAVIDGIHAKLLIAEDNKGRAVTFVGSANATGPAWGMGSVTNVEAMVEMRPGIPLDRFVARFIRETRTKVHPWIEEYNPEARSQPDADRLEERRVLAALREVAKLQFRLRYDKATRTLSLSADSKARRLPPWVVEGRHFSIAPLNIAGTPGAWRELETVVAGQCSFQDVDVAQLTAFVVLRARNEAPAIECQRLVVAALDVESSLLDSRDDAVRAQILATADPSLVLAALIRGLAHVGGAVERHDRKPGLQKAFAQALDDVTLERLLQAVALEPSLVDDIRQLLGPVYGDEIAKLCDDLDDVVGRVHGGMLS